MWYEYSSKSHQKYHMMGQKSAGGPWEGRPSPWLVSGLVQWGKEEGQGFSLLCTFFPGTLKIPTLYSYSRLTKVAPQPPWSGADSSCGRAIPSTKRWCSPAFSEGSPSFGQGLQYYKDSFPILLPTIILHLMVTLSKLLTYSLFSTPFFPSHCFVLICIKLQFL